MSISPQAEGAPSPAQQAASRPWKHFRMLASGGVPLASAVERAIALRPQEWERETGRQTHPGSPHAATRAIYLRHLAWPGLTAARVFNDLEVVDWPALQLCGEFQWLLRTVGAFLPGPIARAVIVELIPGGSIVPHVDEGLYSSVTDRHHFCIAADPDAMLWVGEDENSAEFLHIPPGELWTINKDVLHGAENPGTAPRWHLIVDSWRNGGLK